MKLVIDIDEDYYEIIKHDVKANHNDFKPYTIIANGTPLPKGHGDLIDRQALIDNGIKKGFCDWYDEIEMADTIIKADKGETE